MLKRSELRRGTTPLRRTRLKPGRWNKTPLPAVGRDEWYAGEAACEICPQEGGVCDGPVQRHHAIDRQALRHYEFVEHMWDLRLRVDVCERRHAAHTTRRKPIPLALLPQSVFEAANEIRMEWWLERTYGTASANTGDDCVAVVVVKTEEA